MDFRSIKLYKGEEVDLDNLVHSLAGFGYRRQASVGDQGEFALRGGVLDIFPVTFDFPLRIDLDGAGISSIASFDIASGRRLFEHTIVIILPKRRPQASRFRSDQPLENFIDLRPGDYVVHTQYGIGRYRGITRQECPGKTSSSGSGRDKQDHMVIEYAQGDRLYVPKEFMHLGQKYIPCCGAGPRLRRR
ncbi:MAG: CarD family transcriptional regulator, partial [Candidatus Omnitrophota bacterium]